MKEIEIELTCDLTQEEIQFRAQELGTAIVEYDDVDEARKDASKEYAEDLKRIGMRMRHLSQVVRSKSERRMVKCLVNFHTPVNGMKEVVRLDTGELARSERMSVDEMQLHIFEPEQPAG